MISVCHAPSTWREMLENKLHANTQRTSLLMRSTLFVVSGARLPSLSMDDARLIGAGDGAAKGVATAGVIGLMGIMGAGDIPGT